MYRKSLVFVLLALIAATSWSCSGTPKKKDEKLVTDAGPISAYLASIPADTPYVFAALEPFPGNIVIDKMRDFQGVYDQMLAGSEQQLASEAFEPSTRAVVALMNEFKGNLSREGFARLGLTTTPRFAVYGIGVLPVLRFDIDDPGKFEEFVQRVEQKAGLEPTIETAGDAQYRTYTSGDHMTVVSVLGKEAVVAYMRRPARDLVLPYVLGTKMPEKSLASEKRLEEIVDKYGVKSYGVGFVDLTVLGRMFLQPGEGLNDQVLAALDTEMPDASSICRTEILGLLEQAPRIVFGYESFDETHFSGLTGLELRNDLGSRLAATRAPAPGFEAASSDQAVAGVSFGFEVGKLVAVVRELASSLRQEPFQCEEFQDLNASAAEIATYLQLMPPFLSTIRGGSLVLDDVRIDAAGTPAPGASPSPNPAMQAQPPVSGMPDVTVRAMMLLGSQDPVTLFDMLKMFAPPLASVQVNPDGQPVAVPPSEELEFLKSPFVVMTQNMLGASIGEGMQDELSTTIAKAPAGDTPFLYFGYNWQKLMGTLSQTLGQDDMSTQLAQVMGDGQTKFFVIPNDDGIFVRVTQPIDLKPEAR